MSIDRGDLNVQNVPVSNLSCDAQRGTPCSEWFRNSVALHSAHCSNAKRARTIYAGKVEPKRGTRSRCQRSKVPACGLRYAVQKQQKAKALRWSNFNSAKRFDRLRRGAAVQYGNTKKKHQRWWKIGDQEESKCGDCWDRVIIDNSGWHDLVKSNVGLGGLFMLRLFDC
ncbi:hypothetical protein BJ165DRAFT_1403128 [Panaeolus papilionaceus]|nr:hypothetical protein BJ165DRAFT_1403128 [Panaeolus papilionaceus]